MKKFLRIVNQINRQTKNKTKEHRFKIVRHILMCQMTLNNNECISLLKL